MTTLYVGTHLAEDLVGAAAYQVGFVEWVVQPQAGVAAVKFGPAEVK